MFSKISKLLLLIFLMLHVNAYAIAFDLAKKYPSYTYVFNELDVDRSYIYDAEFIDFVFKHEKALRAFYKRSLQRGQNVLPMMKRSLLANGMSDLFIYLSMIESGFSSKAVSAKKAVGLWQFMPATAKEYDLNVCDSEDERCNPTAATSAAINHLNRLYKEFGKWYLAAMAYNCGEGCLKYAIEKARTDDLAILTDSRQHYLPEETCSYIKKILLVAMIGENSTLGFGTIDHDSLRNALIEVEVPMGTSLELLAKKLHMQYKVLQKLNRKSNNSTISQGECKIIIPLEKVFAFYLKYDLQNRHAPSKSYMVSHDVKMGETLESIAREYHTEVSSIIRVNHLEDDFLTLDQFLVIPVDKKVFEGSLEGIIK